MLNKKIERLIQENNWGNSIKNIEKISAIGAIKFNNDIMVKIEDSYFMVFEWLDGKILKAEEITDKHCEIIETFMVDLLGLIIT